MKKIALLAAGITMISTSAFSQTSTTTTTGGVRWGLKVGVNLPKYSYHLDDEENPETKTATNFHVRGFVDLPVSTMFSIQPGVAVEGKGGKLVDTENAEIKQNTMWVEVPVNLVGKIPLGVTGSNIYLGAGPYAALGISGETKYKLGDTETKTDVKFGDDEDLKSLDLGVNFMGGVHLGSGFLIGAQYGLGLNDLRPKGEGGDGKVTNRVLSFSVGFLF